MTTITTYDKCCYINMYLITTSEGTPTWSGSSGEQLALPEDG